MTEIKKGRFTVMNEDGTVITTDDEIPVIELDYSKYQVVRGEYFSHVREPSITFKDNKISLNMACIRRLPEVEYVQILVNPDEKKLAVRPSREDEKDSFVWCTTGEIRKPKQITCRVFFAKIMDAMGWNSDYRYKLLGKLIRSENELLFSFDLNATETYPCIIKDGEKPRMSRTPIFPQEWQAEFGLSVEEHCKRLQVNIFKGYTVFSVNETVEIAEQSN